VSAIDLRNVSYFVPGGPRILDRVTLAVEPGEVVALVGRSGSGKTTMLRLVNRLLEPAEGQVLVDGRDTRAWDPIQLRRSIGYVIQDVGLFPHLSVGDNIAVVPKLQRWEPPRVAARVAEVLQLVGLPPAFAGRWPDELSGGQRQRVGVARALAANPAVLLLDEPFGALDPITRAELQTEFGAIQRALGKTVILVTHDMREALLLADRLAVLDEGNIVACDSPISIARSPDARVRRLLEAVTVPAELTTQDSRPKTRDSRLETDPCP
jgi:osmoprotectant transport system ATP-binding protein